MSTAGPSRFARTRARVRDGLRLLGGGTEGARDTPYERALGIAFDQVRHHGGA